MGSRNDWLKQDGMPSRPFEYSGTLVKPLRTPRTASQIFAACKRLGYDGRVPLTFRLRLGTRLKAGLVFESICASEFGMIELRRSEEGDLVVQSPIVLHGGVSAQNLHVTFGIWKQTIGQIVGGLN